MLATQAWLPTPAVEAMTYPAPQAEQSTAELVAQSVASDPVPTVGVPPVHVQVLATQA